MSRAWIFDLDGTLADTDRDIREAWKAALGDLALECPRFDREFVAGPPIDEMTRRLFPERYTDELADSIRVLFARHYDGDGFPNTFEYPGVLDAVRRLKATGAKVYIATNKRYAGALGIADKFGWRTVFDGIYAGDMYREAAESWRAEKLARTGLPAGTVKLTKTQLLAHLTVEEGLERAGCTMVGDTAGDFEAARANGIASVGVVWGYGTAAELELADRQVTTADEIR